MEFLLSGFDSFLIRWIHHVDNRLSVLIIVPPERSDLILSSDIPNCHFYLLEFDCFDIETDSWYCGDELSQFELIERSCLASAIQTEEKNSHFPFREEKRKHSGKVCPHFKFDIPKFIQSGFSVQSDSEKNWQKYIVRIYWLLGLEAYRRQRRSELETRLPGFRYPSIS